MRPLILPSAADGGRARSERPTNSANEAQEIHPGVAGRGRGKDWPHGFDLSPRSVPGDRLEGVAAAPDGPTCECHCREVGMA